MEPSQDDGIDRGENRTVHAVTHAAIKATGKAQCTTHSWRKLSETELACTNCMTAIICGIDDERLLDKTAKM